MSYIVKACKYIVDNEEKIRQSGRTSLLAGIVKLISSFGKKFLMVCHNQYWANHVAHDFNISTVSLSKLGSDNQAHIEPEPMIFDNATVFVIAREVVALHDELEKLKMRCEKNPITLIKIGNKDGTPVQPETLEAWRKVFEMAKSDEDFKIFSHDEVTIKTMEVYPNVEVEAE